MEAFDFELYLPVFTNGWVGVVTGVGRVLRSEICQKVSIVGWIKDLINKTSNKILIKTLSKIISGKMLFSRFIIQNNYEVHICLSILGYFG